ncbi:outer membrane protein [Shewanella sediminis HAW-EB3]|uniref:Outer membrane protein n=1 Tax=Shewanella sediminis (strain HAW-EB3) TaxID=425104 RepID=A8FSU4_SHESH|nr:MtrB/PioB family decaheme-associated outer membrane protein [Shewanella sediminis]ABV35917.1 outer membrane protein [Shewanella sediminis HAW-EB3]
MKFQLSVIALAIVQVGSANAVGFSLSGANLEQANTVKWRCRSCESTAVSGEMGVSVVGTDTDNARAANSFGEDSEFAGALQADALYQKEGARIRVQANNLGMETGNGRIAYDSERYGFDVGYQSQLRVDTDKALTDYGMESRGNGGYNLVDTGNVRSTDLEKKRETWTLGTEVKAQDWGMGGGIAWRGFADYLYQQKTGQQASSTQVNKRPVNFVKPIDSTSQILKAGGELLGEDWIATLSYQGSLFENDLGGLYNGEMESLQAFEPGNEAHQVIAQGQYRLDSTYLTGRVVKGWLYQNDDYIDLTGVPNGISHLNGEVATLDANFKVSTRLSRGLKVGFKADYRDRDNKTPVQMFNRIDYDEMSGKATENVQLNSEKSSYQVDVNYRLRKALRFSGGYQRTDKEQSNTVREKTSEDRVFAKLKYNLSKGWGISLEGEYGNRDGSTYQASSATSSEDNELLRKYHLADRDRTELELKVGNTSFDNLGINLSYRYALDDYSESELGLSESIDNGYDVSISYQPIAKLDIYAFGGQQWIESTRYGSQGYSSADWTGNVDDSFSHIGLGTSYSGLMQELLVVGLNYSYSESESETSVTRTTPYGEYYSWSHNLRLYAEFALSERAKVHANYRYERYYDTDYRDVTDETFSELTTLGNMGSNYNAHQLMLTFSYAL